VETAAGEQPPAEPAAYGRERAVVAAAIAPVVPEGTEPAAGSDRTGQGG
jgi:hypothetical protein